MNYKVTLTILLFIFCNIYNLFSQKLIEYEEIKDVSGLNIKNTRTDKALIVINSVIPLTIEASNDNINSDNLIIENNYYYYYTEPPTQTVSLISQGFLETSITLQGLKAKDIKYFKVKSEPLENKYSTTYEEITNLFETKDVAAFGYDALIVIYSERFIEISSTKSISKSEQKGEEFSVFLKPEPQTLTIKSSSSKDLEITLKELKKGSPRYFKIIFSNQQIKGSETFNANVKPGDYEIITNPPGARIELTDEYGKIDKEFEIMRLTPYKTHKQGIYIMKLTYPEYENRIDTIKFGEKKNTGNYTLIPKFSHIIIEKTPTEADIFIDNNTIKNYKIEKDGIKIDKGSRKISIKAKHFYSFDTTIFTEPFKIHRIKKDLKPIKGKLTVKQGNNSLGAEVYINEEKIGNIPLTNYTLQEGEYTLRIYKKGFSTLKPDYKISIDENRTTFFEESEMVSAIKVSIKTEPVTGANVYIDGKQLEGTTNIKTRIGLGEHDIKIEREKYETLDTKINITVDKEEYIFKIEPKLYKLHISSESDKINTIATKNYIFIDDVLMGTSPQTIELTTGKHNFKLKSETNRSNKKKFTNKKYRKRFSTNIHIPSNYNKDYPVYFHSGFSLLDYEYDNRSHIYSFGRWYFYGINNTIVKLIYYKGIEYQSYAANADVRIGIPITRHINLSLIGSYVSGRGAGKDSTKQINRLFYGGELSTRICNHNMFKVINFFVRGGMQRYSGTEIESKNEITFTFGTNLFLSGDPYFYIRRRPIFKRY